MRLKYTVADGRIIVVPLTEVPITIGRGHENDVVLPDEKVSRIHCGLRWWDGAYYLKDLQSHNGTWVNEERIDVVRLLAGDHLRVGGTVLTFETGYQAGTETILLETDQQLAAGKGYSTILREIVHDLEAPGAPPPPPIPKTVKIPKARA
ncbi:MAG: FHA domain-containing protein [Kiritimatiellaeota bacterium]|nr:FHA domain-containing protein [Kiritimatiellota bacterium]